MDLRWVFNGNMALHGARRAEVFRQTLEEVRRARAEAMVLMDRPALPQRDTWQAVRRTQAGCQGLAGRLDQDHGLMGRELTEDLRSYVALMDSSLSELVLGRLLGGDDDIGRGALGRARRGIVEDAQRLESTIRRKMALLLAAPRPLHLGAGPS